MGYGEFADSGQKALDLFKERPFAVVVSDIRMPGMDGVQLLTKIMALYPETVRIAMSGEAEGDLLEQATSVSHQYLSKPYDFNRLKSTVWSGCALNDVISRVPTIASLPAVYEELLQVINSPHGNTALIGELLSRDIGMTAKILHLVNSAFFGMRVHISSASQAVSLLGYERVKSLILGVQIFSRLDSKEVSVSFAGSLWEHSIRTAALAKTIAEKETRTVKTADNAFLAGILHDLGKLVLASAFPPKYRTIIDMARMDHTPFFDAEQEVLGITHAEIGEYLGGLWGLPSPIVNVIAFHHNPMKCLETSFNPLTAVHAANALDHEHNSTDGEKTYASIDFEYLTSLNKTGRVPVWRKLQLETHDREPE